PASELGVQELERNGGAEHFVPSFVDASHSAVPDEADKSVLVVDDLAYLGAHRVPCGELGLVGESHKRVDERQPNSCDGSAQAMGAPDSQVLVKARLRPERGLDTPEAVARAQVLRSQGQPKFCRRTLVHPRCGRVRPMRWIVVTQLVRADIASPVKVEDCRS